MKDFQRLPLNALKTFEAAARLGSFRSAADELCVTHGAVSQQVKRLEAYFSLPLVEKQGRGIALTADGENLFLQLQPVLSSLGSLARSINPLSTSGPLKVGCSSDTAVLWLVPALKEFCNQHPDIELDIRNLSPSNTSTLDVDVAILNQLPEAEHPYCTLLSDQFFFPVCSPELVKDLPSTASAITSTPLLHADRGGLWAAWYRESANQYPESNQHIYLPGGAAVISGAMNGLGIALAHKLEVQTALNKGELIKCGDYSIKAAQAYFISTSSKYSTTKASLFIQWLQHYCRQ